MKQRCEQCWKRRAPGFFVGKKGQPVKRCSVCRRKYRGWAAKTPEQKAALRSHRRGLRTSGEVRVTISLRSMNRKTGPIPVSMSSAETCPKSCSFYGAGCYGEFHWLRHQWSKVDKRGMTWAAFCKVVRELRAGTLWRHNEVGDLPGSARGDLYVAPLRELTAANAGRRGFTFTHRVPKTEGQRRALRDANGYGFTVNLSADSLEDADRKAELRCGPVAVVVPTDAPRGIRTPAGRPIVLCPAETHGLTCAQCRLCANATRKTIVGFRAHGQMSGHVSELVQLRRQ